MSHDEPVYFAQITDAHVGPRAMNPREAEWNLRWALDEIAALSPRPQAIIATADLVNAGTREELEAYCRIASGSAVPIYALPANHDLWGEEDESAWLELIGPLRQRVELGPLVILLWGDILRADGGRWKARLGEEQHRWLERELDASAGRPVVVAHHAPLLPIGDDFHDTWAGSNARQAIDLFLRHSVLATITGHWHRVGEWNALGLRVINTGALAGWQWIGTPPHWAFPVRPGYRLLRYAAGELRSFWRDGSYWMSPPPAAQVHLEWLGEAHTGGPRPQVRPPTVSGPVTVTAKSFALGGRVEAVEFSVARGHWEPMRRVFDDVWSEWQADFQPRRLRPGGPYPLCVRAVVGGKPVAYDCVPVFIGERDAGLYLPQAAVPGTEQLWTLFYPPDGD